MQRLSKIALSLITLLGANSANSQEAMPAVNSGDPLVSLKLDTRFDGVVTTFGEDEMGEKADTKAGFQGSYLKLIVNGTINEHFSYAFRHRLYKDNGSPRSFFNATDWVNLTYRPDDHWSVTAGKQVVLVGTMEYDYAPIDMYYASYYWNHCNPYQIGVNVGYRLNEGNQVLAQITNSPYADSDLNSTFAYNLLWYGKLAPWLNTIYSVNMMEYEKGRFLNYLALGHRLTLDRVVVDLDWMNRYGGHGTSFFKDFTLSSKVALDVNDRVRLFVKGGYDQNKAQSADAATAYDTYVVPGTSRGFWGCGVEYSPLIDNPSKVRFHAYWHSSTDDPSENTFAIGVRWQMDVLNLTR